MVGVPCFSKVMSEPQKTSIDNSRPASGVSYLLSPPSGRTGAAARWRLFTTTADVICLVALLAFLRHTEAANAARGAAAQFIACGARHYFPTEENRRGVGGSLVRQRCREDDKAPSQSNSEAK